MKPDLVYLMNGHRLNTVAISIAGNIERTVVLAALSGVPISPICAQQVLDGVNTLAETQYTLDLVGIKIISTIHNEEGANNGTLGKHTTTARDPG